MSNSPSRSSPLSIHSLCQSSRRSPERPFVDDQISQYPPANDENDDRVSGLRNLTSRHTMGPSFSERHNGIETLRQTRVATLQRTMDAGKAAEQTQRERTAKVTLPSFRESFAFALRDVDEPGFQYSLRTQCPSRFPSVLPPPYPSHASNPRDDIAESRFASRAQMQPKPRFSPRYDAPSKPTVLGCRYARRSLSFQDVREFDTEFMSSDSSSDYETDYTLPTSSAPSECSYKGAVSPMNGPRRLPANIQELHNTASPLSTVGCFSISSPPPPPPQATRQPVQERFNFLPADRIPVAKKARTMSETAYLHTNAGPPPVAFPPSPTFREPPPAASEPPTTQWPRVSEASPQRGTLRSRRPRPSDAPRLEWEDYAVTLESPRDHYQCLWNEDGLECYYHAKKQAMKRHVELTHLNYRPHQCHLCDKSYGQRTSLKVHLATHTGDKDYVCPEKDCTQEYSDASRLLRHRVRVHGYIVRQTAPKLRYRPRLSTIVPSPKRQNDLIRTAKEQVKRRRHIEVYSA